MVAFAVVLAFMAAFLLALALLSLGEGSLRAPMRLLRSRLATRSVMPIPVFRDNTVSSLPRLQRVLSRMPLARRLGKYLDQADLSQRVGAVVGLVLLLAVIASWLVWRLTSSWLWPILGAGAFGSLPLLYIRRQRRLRLDLYAKQLPDALDVLSRSLQAGQSFMQGIHTVAREMPEPTAKEFRMTFEELRLGRSIREALQAHADRVECLDFNLLSTALLIQREVGGNLVEILETASQTIRERYKLLGQVQALSAQNRLGAKIVGVLPLAIGGIVYFLKPDLIMVLFKDEFGRKLVVTAIAMQLMGYYVMKRIITIKI
ncbi:Bacterial type II secretion system protein F domain protein [Candidatus Methylomirabilis lanthanidiphila]|uniref:Bacterial type II secretion system protein F domain protein n=1 Tax=Candidatus Methylomirabilis lanthanidiphila TaxID=2211376 RepID=A0A564ZGW1_9BACT|nr:type II secretion system F family protein [Candidatus Methylomirabilis lanthanidiphila]VUZ84366.1 Bacterial type II secretion system protein F domain protein [Candidatus Methylomirabilis lanthanidiphila]